MIENDKKNKGSIKKYLMEMDPNHKIREFDSPELFEERYFQYTLDHDSNEKQGIMTIAEMGTYPQDKLEWLKSQNLSTIEPFSPNPLVLSLNKEDLTISSVDRVLEVNILGQKAEDLLSGKVTLESIAPKDFASEWKAALHKLKTTGNIKTVLPIDSGKGLWLFEVTGQLEAKGYKLSLTDFTKKASPFLESASSEKKKSEEDDAFQLMGTIHLIIFRSDLVTSAPIIEWVAQLQDKLKKAKYWPDHTHTRTIALKYDDDGAPKHNFLHPLIDDLISLPMDRLIFMQKIEITLGLPSRVKPSFMFTEKTDEQVNISKKCQVDVINDLGIAVTNPIALNIGAEAHFYLKLPHREKPLSLLTKVVGSKPHPTLDGKFLCYFAYFGITRSQNKIIRDFIGSDSNYKPLVSTDPEAFRFNPHNLFLDKEQKQRKNVVIIDSDEGQCNTLKDAIEREMDNVKAVVVSSYYLFAKKYLSGDTETKVFAPIVAETEMFRPEISWLINPNNHNLVQCLTPYSGIERLLSHEVKELYEKPQGWLSLFALRDSKELLLEALFMVTDGQRVDRFIELSGPENMNRTFKVSFIPVDNGDNVKIILTRPSEGSVNTDPSVKLDTIDGLIINNNFIPESVTEWHTGLQELVEQHYYKLQKNPTKVFVIGNEGSFEPKRFFNTPISAVILKPIETKRLLFLISSILDTPFSIYTFDNIGWKNTKLVGYMAKAARLVQVGEYGAALQLNRGLKQGTALYLHESIYDNAPDGSLCAKVYFTEVDKDSASKTPMYICFLIYFGINDAFLKFTRAWIRERYASQKEKQGN